MRDHLKNEEYWLEFIRSQTELNEKRILKIRNNQINPERLNIVKRDLVWKIITTMIAKYSFGLNKDAIREDCELVCQLIEESWDEKGWKLVSEDSNSIVNTYTFFGYNQMLWMLSISYLLGVKKAAITKLIEVIKRDEVYDSLFDFIIINGMKWDTKKANPTKDRLEKYGILKKTILNNDTNQRANLIKKHLDNDWYKDNKESGWYNSHKSKHSTYFGYWSFETAAIVKIMGLDDSSFRDCQYYPADLVHQ